MKLVELLSGVMVQDLNVSMNIEIEHITNDSRDVLKNSIFIAIKGHITDGNKYIAQAVEKGANVVICEQKPEGDVPYIIVRDARIAMSEISDNFYKNPSNSMNMIGITGTNGKTTVTYLIKHILEKLDKKVGLIGTNQNMIGQQVLETERTTPESYEIQKLFNDMKQQECTQVVMEVSSHALALSRVNNVAFDVGVFTNLSQDHLDYHKTMEEYANAKAILFKKCKYGIVNLDDKYSGVMMENAKCNIITYGIDNDKADLVASNVALNENGVIFDVTYSNQTQVATLQIPGKFSVYNALSAIGSCLALSYSLEDIVKALETASGVCGRVEVVKTNTDYTVLIDYAHSPDGIINVLKTVKGYAKGRVIGLFGCGGDRDKTKRPLMAKATAKHADFCIITSDNPRTENPSDIIKDIVAGLENIECQYEVIEDRKKAIVYALDNAKTGDVIVLMGKGHEIYQEINGIKHHLDEREEVFKYFA